MVTTADFKAHPSTAEGSVTHDDMVQRARGLFPFLRKSIDKVDAARQLPAEVFEKLYEAGFMKMLAPRRYGGYQLGLDTYAAVCAELAKADASAAWVVCLLNGCMYLSTRLFGDDVHRELFASALGPRIAGVIASGVSKVKRVEGGYLIEQGKWHFNSGVYHAEWDLLYIDTVDEKGQPNGAACCLVPIKDVTIHDEWFTIGLRGSGSTSVSVSHLFVPQERVGPMSDVMGGKVVKNALANDAPYTGALAPVLAISLAYPPVGVAQGAFEVFLEKLPNRRIPYTWYTKSADAAVVQIAIADASAKIDCAKLLIEKANRDIADWAEKHPGEQMPQLMRGRIRRDTGYVCNLCYEAVNVLSEASGGSFTAESNILNRMWRDTRTISLHGFTANTTSLELYGRLLCGLEPNTHLV